MQQYTNLAVWSQAHAMVLRVYRSTDDFPVRERYGLASQLRRAAVSVPTNIAEGAKRATDRDFAHFVNIAEGSAAEVEYLVTLCSELNLMDSSVASELAASAGLLQRRLCALRRRLLAARSRPLERLPQAVGR